MKIYALQLMTNYFVTRYSWKLGARQFRMLVTKKKKNQRKLKLEKEIPEIKQNLTQNTTYELNEKQNELEQFRSSILKGRCIIRSRAKWIEEGEQPIK